MPFVRNPFRKQDENTRPVPVDGITRSNSDSSKSAETSEVDVEYKLSDINDSGICLPPSPVERKAFWGHTNSSRSTTSHRNLVNDHDQFSISRESFDSYRRSFDISGRSPIIRPNEYQSRGSLDSRTFQSPTRPSTNGFARPAPVPIVSSVTKEEDFEDVGLDDVKPQVKKRGLFARLTEPAADSVDRPVSSHEKSSWHHFGARKRGQSGQGAELGAYPGEMTPRRDETPKPIDSGFKIPPPPTIEAVQAPSA